jgi:preprotein translocase subunit YajC
MLNALKPGDKIITSSGIFGTIVSVREDRVQVKIAPSVAVEVQRTAIGGLQAEAKEGEAAK